MSLKIVFIFTNSADPDQMPPYVSFHLGLHFLPKYLFTGIQNEKCYIVVVEQLQLWRGRRPTGPKFLKKKCLSAVFCLPSN